MGRLKPQPFREIKRRLEAVGSLEASQKGSHVKWVRCVGGVVDTAIGPKKPEVPVGHTSQHPESSAYRLRSMGKAGLIAGVASEVLPYPKSFLLACGG